MIANIMYSVESGKKIDNTPAISIEEPIHTLYITSRAIVISSFLDSFTPS